MARQNLTRRLQTIEVGHPDVHEHHVGLVLRCQSDSLQAVSRLAHDLDIAGTLQHHSHARPDERLVVG
jgi:hypothetical protein